MNKKREEIIKVIDEYKKANKKIAKTLYINDLLFKEIEKLSKTNKISPSELINEILRDYLQK